MVVDEYLEKGNPKLLVLKYVGLPRSSYYYTSTGTKPGKKASRVVYDLENNRHDLGSVLQETKSLLEGEFVDYGYYKTYRYLNQEKGLKIGAYRTYKLMKEHNLLKFQRNNIKRTSKNWVKELVPKVQSEFSFLELDRGGGPH